MTDYERQVIATTARQVATMSPDERADYEERAAIMEFDGRLTRASAEMAAARLVVSARR